MLLDVQLFDFPQQRLKNFPDVSFWRTSLPPECGIGLGSRRTFWQVTLLLSQLRDPTRSLRHGPN
jgi:hypothetical protein